MPAGLLAIDPGIRGCGCAFFDGGRLTKAAYVKNPMKEGNTAAAARAMAGAVLELFVPYGAVVNAIALEWPRIYASRIRAGATKADPNDLLGLAAVDAAIAMLLRYAHVDCFAPSDWKGQLPKAAAETRIRGRLSEAELAVLDAADAPPSLLHNVVDAVGIGLHRLGRGFVDAGRKRAA